MFGPKPRNRSASPIQTKSSNTPRVPFFVQLRGACLQPAFRHLGCAENRAVRNLARQIRKGINIFPDDLPIRRDFEDAAISAFADQSVAVRLTLSPADI